MISRRLNIAIVPLILVFAAIIGDKLADILYRSARLPAGRFRPRTNVARAPRHMSGRPSYAGTFNTCPGWMKSGSGPITLLFASYSVRQSSMPRLAAIVDSVSPARTV